MAALFGHLRAMLLASWSTKTRPKRSAKLKEVNTGIMAMPNAHLTKWLAQLTNNNAQREYYLTDIVEFAVKDKVEVVAEVTADEWSVTGINSKLDLAQIERVHQNRIAITIVAARRYAAKTQPAWMCVAIYNVAAMWKLT